MRKNRLPIFNIFERTIGERKWTVVVYFIFAVALIFMYVVFFPSVQQSSAEVSELVKNLPESLVKSFGLDPKSFTTFEGFLAGKHFSLVWPFLLIALLVSLGASFFAGEIEKGTIEILLSQPISRTRIFFEKFLAGILIILIFVFFSFGAIFPMAEAFNISYKAGRFINLSLIGFIFGLAIFGLSLFFSSIFSEKNKVTFLVVGILIFMYVLNIVSGLKESLDKLKYFSFFYYFNPPQVLVHNKVDCQSLIVFLSVFLVATFLALIWFKKRDIAI